MQLNVYNIEAYLREHLDPIGIPYHVEVVMWPSARTLTAVVVINGVTYPELRDDYSSALIEMAVLHYKKEHLKATVKAIYEE
jgi:hypothetical protein